MTQNQSIENHALSHALYEELEALKIRIAFAEISEDEIETLERELASVSEPDYSEQAQRRTLREIERRLNRRHRKRFVLKTLPRTLNVISTALLIFFLGLTTATATIRPVRLRLLEFIAQIEEHYSAVSLIYSENDKAIVPQEWRGEYYPIYIPEGFVLNDVDGRLNTVGYITEDERVLEFGEFKDEAYTSVDLNNDSVIDISILGSKAIAEMSEEGVAITWGVEDTYFYLYFSGDLDEAERIAESVQPVH